MTPNTDIDAWVGRLGALWGPSPEMREALAAYAMATRTRSRGPGGGLTQDQLDDARARALRAGLRLALGRRNAPQHVFVGGAWLTDDAGARRLVRPERDLTPAQFEEWLSVEAVRAAVGVALWHDYVPGDGRFLDEALRRDAPPPPIVPPKPSTSDGLAALRTYVRAQREAWRQFGSREWWASDYRGRQVYEDVFEPGYSMERWRREFGEAHQLARTLIEEFIEEPDIDADILAEGVRLTREQFAAYRRDPGAMAPSITANLAIELMVLADAERAAFLDKCDRLYVLALSARGWEAGEDDEEGEEEAPARVVEDEHEWSGSPLGAPCYTLAPSRAVTLVEAYASTSRQKGDKEKSWRLRGELTRYRDARVAAEGRPWSDVKRDILHGALHVAFDDQFREQTWRRGTKWKTDADGKKLKIIPAHLPPEEFLEWLRARTFEAAEHDLLHSTDMSSPEVISALKEPRRRAGGAAGAGRAAAEKGGPEKEYEGQRTGWGRRFGKGYRKAAAGAAEMGDSEDENLWDADDTDRWERRYGGPDDDSALAERRDEARDLSLAELAERPHAPTRWRFPYTLAEIRQVATMQQWQIAEALASRECRTRADVDRKLGLRDGQTRVQLHELLKRLAKQFGDRTSRAPGAVVERFISRRDGRVRFQVRGGPSSAFRPSVGHVVPPDEARKAYREASGGDKRRRRRRRRRAS